MRTADSQVVFKREPMDSVRLLLMVGNAVFSCESACNGAQRLRFWRASVGAIQFYSPF